MYGEQKEKAMKKNDISVEIGHDDRGAHNVAGNGKKKKESEMEAAEKAMPEALREYMKQKQKKAEKAVKDEDDMAEKAESKDEMDKMCGPGYKAMDVKKAEEEDEEEEGEEKAKKAKMDKSLISEEDLLKSLSRLEQVAKSGSGARKQELLQKSLAGNLSDGESSELIKLLSGIREAGLREQVAKSMSGADNDELAKSIDVSSYIAELHKTLVDNMTSLATSIEKSEARSADRESVLAKGLLDLTKAMISQGRLVKSLQDKVDSFGRAPAHGPRAVHNVDQLAKSGLAPSNPGLRLSNDDVLDTLEQMMHKSIVDGGDGVAVSGETFEQAISKFEQTQMIHPSLLNAVVQFRQGR